MKRISLLFIFLVLLLTLFSSANSGTSAQTTEQYLSELALEKFEQKEEFAQMRMSVENQDTEVQYSPFEVSFVEIHGDWARLHITSVPETFYNDAGELQGLPFQGVVANFDGSDWQIVFENTAEFEALKSRLPFWLQFLNVPESPDFLDNVSVPSLPWAFGVTWRLNQGLHDAEVYGFDFGVLPYDTSQPIHAVDTGVVVYQGFTCVITNRSSDGLEMYYQHVEPTDADDWQVGELMKMGDFVGNTTEIDGCGGESFGHHVHFAFFNAHDGDVGNPPFSSDQYDGSTINGWLIDFHPEHANDPSKNVSMIRTYDDGSTQTVTPNTGSGTNLSNRLFNSGCIAHEINNQSGPLLRLYNEKSCTGEMWYTNQINQVISIGSFSPYSLNIMDGYSVVVYNPQNPPSMEACYTGDLWDMTKDYYPGTSYSIANNIGSVKVVAGGCQCQNATGEDGLEGSNSCPDSPPPPDVLPPAVGPQTGSTVKIYAYPNYQGEVQFSGGLGFSNEPNAIGYSMEIPSGWSVITYRDDNMQGMSECWNANVPNFQDHNDWQTKTQSVFIFNQNVCATDDPSPTLTPAVQFYSNINYQNPNRDYNYGFHDHVNFYAGSLELKEGRSVVLYRLDKRQSVNQAFCYNRSVPNLDAAGWPYEIVGLEVFGFDVCQDQLDLNYKVVFFQNEGIVGDGCGVYGVAEAPDLTNWCGANWNDQFSSLRVKAGWSVKVWENANYQGGDKCFSNTLTTFRNDALSNGVSIAVGENDSVISSFAVFDNAHCDGSPIMPESAWAQAVDNGNLALGQFVMDASENNDQSVTVSWEPSIETVDGYRIYEYVGDNAYELWMTTAPSVTSTQFDNLPCGTDFHFLVKAYNQWGESATPSLVVASTPSCFVEPVEGPEPFPPTNLQLSNITKTSVTATWQDNSEIEDNYRAIVTGTDGSWHNIYIPANTTSKVITGLTCEVDYDIRVRVEHVVDNVVYGGYTDYEYFTTQSCTQSQNTTIYLPLIVKPAPQEGPTPNAPTNLHLTGSSENSLSVSWNDNSGIEDVFEIWYQVSGGSWQNPSVPANTTQHTLTGLTCGSEYSIVVRAVRWENGTVYYSESNFITVQTEECYNPVPNAPTNLHSTGTTLNSISLAWNDNSIIEDYSEVWYQAQGNPWQVKYIYANVSTTTLTGLICSKSYEIQVHAYNYENGQTYQSESNTINVTTASCGSIPAQPTNLHSDLMTFDEIALEWIDNSNNETSFTVYERINGSDVQVGVAQPNATVFIVSGLVCGTTHTYLVTADNPAGSSQSNLLQTGITCENQNGPTAPSDLQVTQFSQNQVTLTWQDNSSNETTFRIHGYLGGVYLTPQYVNANVELFVFTGLTCNTEYVFWVSAVNANGYSPSNLVIQRTQVCN